MIRSVRPASLWPKKGGPGSRLAVVEADEELGSGARMINSVLITLAEIAAVDRVLRLELLSNGTLVTIQGGIRRLSRAQVCRRATQRDRWP